MTSEQAFHGAVSGDRHDGHPQEKDYGNGTYQLVSPYARQSFIQPPTRSTSSLALQATATATRHIFTKEWVLRTR